MSAALLCAALSDATAATRLPPVAVGEAERRPVVQEIAVTGSVVSPRMSRVSTEVSGWVSEVHVEVGDRVDRGAPLVSLDDELATIALAAARAAVREARAARADAERRFAEAERLTAERTIAQTEVHARRAEVEMDAAALERSEAEVRRQEALLARHRLEAPFTGAVSRKLTNPGEWVAPGTPVVELVETDALRIDFAVPQEIYPRVQTGMSVEIGLDALPGRLLAARVVGVVPMSDGDSRTFLLLTRLEDPDVPLISGMSARARLRLDAGREGVTVPRDALLRHRDGRVTVWVVSRADGGASVSERRVRTGRAFDGRVEITEGLEPGTAIVVRGNEGLQEGQRVVVDGPTP